MHSSYRQDPQCEGKHRDRIFLQGATIRRPTNYTVTEAATLGEYVIHEAGEAVGITSGAAFTVYDTDACTNEIGRLVVNRSTSFQSTARPAEGRSFNITKPAGFAILTQRGVTEDVRLRVDNSDLANSFTIWAEQLRTESADRPSFQVVKENPHLIVTASEGKVCFEITDEICRTAQLMEIPHRSSMDSATMTNILLGVANFYWNLRRTTSRNDIISRTKIQLECYELADDINGGMSCTGNNLFVDGAIQVYITDDEEKAYGISIENPAHNLPLFVSIFYFNMSDLSIGEFQFVLNTTGV